MRREKKNQEKNLDRRKWLSVVGFLISITLLSIAIIISMNQEKSDRVARANNIMGNSTNKSNMLQMASSELSKTINEVKNANTTNSTDNGIEEGKNLNKTSNNQTTGTTTENKNTTENKAIDNKTTETPITQQFIKPVEGEISKGYSVDSLVYSDTLQEWVTHRGIDIKADKTTVVKASSAGTIKSVKEDPRYGLSITIEHEDGFTTVYSSLLSSEFIKEGDKVEQGQSIGTVGNSAVFESADGTHLHFEILKNGEYVNPEIYIK